MTLREAQKLYTRLKRVYYAESPMPLAREIKWHWAGMEKAKYLDPKKELACTVRHKNGNFSVEMHEILKNFPRLFTLILLHEMSHIKDFSKHHGKYFEDEAFRLGKLGVMREFWI